jgi:ferredoxin
MPSSELVDEYLGASGSVRVSRADFELLARYEARNGATQCRYGCGACLAECPEGVPIDDVLRTRMYADDYGDVRFARDEYACLDRNAQACRPPVVRGGMLVRDRHRRADGVDASVARLAI